MIIKRNKFNIDDVVYVAEWADEYYPSPTPMIVEEIRYSESRLLSNISYRIDRDGISEFISESRLFHSYKECMEWCKDHNRSNV